MILGFLCENLVYVLLKFAVLHLRNYPGCKFGVAFTIGICCVGAASKDVRFAAGRYRGLGAGAMLVVGNVFAGLRRILGTKFAKLPRELGDWQQVRFWTCTILSEALIPLVTCLPPKRFPRCETSF